MKDKSALCNGDHVRMYGQACTGEIVRIVGSYATVAFRTIEVNIPLRQLEKVRAVTEAEVPIPLARPTACVLNLDTNAFSSFNPEIDLHGLSVPSALSSLDRWIDKAILLGHKQLKIIHGKGAGILRNAVRTYLRSHGQVKRVIDKHSYRGGEGVTWLEVD